MKSVLVGCVVAVAASAASMVGVPQAVAAPAAVVPSDGAGYLNSTARCAAPDTAMLFGSTSTSRIAICKTASGLEYRGVRVNDGAKLIAVAKQTSPNSYVVTNDGVTYTVTPTALSVTAGGDTFRTETWTDFHGPQAAAGSAAKAPAPAAPAQSPAPAAPAQSPAPAAAAQSPAPAAAAQSPATAAAKPTTAPTSTAPLPPPLAAEVGGR